MRMVANRRDAYSDVNLTMRIRRALISRYIAPNDQPRTGTYIAPPFNRTSLAIRTAIGAPAEGVQHYATRVSSNAPDIEVTPLSAKDEVTVTVDRMAGEQERVDAQLWDEAGGRDVQWKWGWAASTGGVAYLLTLPRDADFGLPDRMYFDDTDDQVAFLRENGRLGPPIELPSGKMIYAEHGDVWAARRKEASKRRAVDGRSLFSLRVYPRDMVVRDYDGDGTSLKYAAIIEDVPFDACGPGSEIAMAWAKRAGKPRDDWSMYQLFLNKQGRIIGGIPQGIPLGSDYKRADHFTIIRYFDRMEYVIAIGAQNDVEGAVEVYRGEHGCRIGGVPACPVEEVAFYRADNNIPGNEFSTALEGVFALTPLLNQIMTLRSNVAAFNMIPRWVVELKDGSILRGEDGEPKIVNAEEVPGLDPQEAAAYEGTLKQLTITSDDSDRLLEIYLELLAKSLPAPVTTGVSGSSAPAWQVQQLIQQAQEKLRQPVDNFAQAVRRIIMRWHSWLRQLDTPIYFFAAPGKRRDARNVRGLIEFNPRDLTDAIMVRLQLDTPAERSVLVEQGRTLLAQGLITYEDFYRDYMGVQDSRQAVINMYVQQAVNHVMGVTPAPPGSEIQIIADGVRGALHYELLNTSPNYALANAREQAASAGQAGPGPMGVPGEGMAPTLPQQLGSNAPGFGETVPGVVA